MSELTRYRSSILRYNASNATFEVGTNGRVLVFSEGASVDQAQSLDSGNPILFVHDVGSFTAGDFARFGNSSNFAQVTTVDSNAPSLEFANINTSVSLLDGDRVINYGGNTSGDTPKVTVYSDDQGDNAISMPLICDASGNYEFFGAAGDYDILELDSVNNLLAINADVTLSPLLRNSSTGVVSLQTVTDDFAVGGSSPTDAALYVDESAETLTLGGPATQAGSPYAKIDGATGQLTLAHATAPTLKLFCSTANFTGSVVPATLTANHTWTAPDLDGTLVLSGPTQTVGGAHTFSAALTAGSTLAVTGAATLSSTLAVTGNATFSGTLTRKRTFVSGETALATTDFALGAGWGSGGSVGVTAVTGTDSRFRVTCTAGTSGWTANPSVTLTFKDGTWTTAPYVLASMNSSSTATKGAVTVNSTATTAVLTYVGTTTSGQTVIFECMIIG